MKNQSVMVTESNMYKESLYSTVMFENRFHILLTTVLSASVLVL